MVPRQLGPTPARPSRVPGRLPTTAARLGAITLLLAALFAQGCARKPSSASAARVIILGVDGMDPEILGKMMAEGKMKSFSRLAASGGFKPLGTSMPPQSPVAWSCFITGLNPGGHRIFDFLRHDRRTLAVAESTSARKDPVTILGLPVWGGGMENLRKGKAFWEYLEDAGVEATILRVPANFPPVARGSRTLSGMGTPDLRGTNGTFTYFTTDPPANAAEFSGGVVEPVKVEGGAVSTFLAGPPNVYRDGSLARAPLAVALDPERPLARIDLDGERRVLQQGEWTDWMRVKFPLFPGVSVRGTVRFHLKEVRPQLRLYASPVNMDPADPPLPISTPEDFAHELCCDLGAFYTQGMAEDTKALRWGVLGDDEFLDQAWSILEESRRLFERELIRFRERSGVLFLYLSSVDALSHMMWRTRDPAHPAHRSDFSERVKASLPRLYEEVDGILARVVREVDERTTLIVMSDHGFAPFYRAVHLENWLAENGYLGLYGSGPPAGKKLQEDVDWSRTRAYALGFNGIYLNLFGREPAGIVTPREKAALLDEISKKLLAWRDPASGGQIVARTYLPEEIYSGPYAAEAPDLIVGYARGYRASWDTPIGRLGPALLEDNVDAWSGDHLMAAELVPGIILSNRPLRKDAPSLVDLPVTVLDLFGITRPADMTGSSVFEDSPAAGAQN